MIKSRANENEKPSIKIHLSSDDPLSISAINDLIDHKEEDLYVDYKQSFDPNDGKHWHDITTDTMAFANTMGGYIVFGVTDSDFSVVGLPEPTVKALVDTNMVMQKFNRHVLPHFSAIRTKAHRTVSGVTIVIMHVPESEGKTHIFVKDVSYTYPSGKNKQLAYAGMMFIRRSATNHVVDPDDLEFIINRRIGYYKDSILNKIAKVVEAPIEHQVLVFDPKTKGDNDKTYYISDSSDAVPVKGMSFTIAPKSDVEELCGWISLSKRDIAFLPGVRRFWYLYSVRNNLTLTDEQAIEIVRFSLLAEMPVFFWLRTLTADQIKPILLQIFKATKNRRILTDVLNIAAFFGKTFHTKILKTSSENVKRVNATSKIFPNDPFQRFSCGMSYNEEDRIHNEEKLTAFAKELSENNGGVLEKLKAKALDCRLYGRIDKYVVCSQ